MPRQDRQFTQEFRAGVGRPGAGAAVAQRSPCEWQAGVVLFTQDYTQDAVNRFAPYVLSPIIPFPVNQHSPQAVLDDGARRSTGRGTLTSASLD